MRLQMQRTKMQASLEEGGSVEMTISERLNQLEKFKAAVEKIMGEKELLEKYVTPVELAAIMNCSKNHVYVQIRKGKIRAISVGASIRIPMSQFNTIIEKRMKDRKSTNKFSISEVRQSVFSE